MTGEVDKRSISTLARTGQLLGKRYVAALAKNGEYPRPSWNKKYTSLEDLADHLDDDSYQTKRYLGALARTGDLRISTREDKRDDVDSLIRDIETADEIRRIRIDALKDELVRDGMDEEGDEDKRSMASVARNGGIPGKRSVEALARIGLLKPITTTHDFTEDMNDFEKKISSDEFEGNDKRGGVSSLARNSWNQKRTVDEELEELMNEVYGIGEKRNVASLARGFNLPSNGKRSEEEDEKRSLSSVMRDRNGKRDEYTNNAIPFVNDKRNVGALAKNRDFPYAYRFGKREVSEEETDDMKKRYVATLLRDGRLPVGPDANSSTQDESQVKEQNSGSEGREDQSQINEDKSQTENERRKKEISEEDRDESHSRKKRETFISSLGEELTGPSGDVEFGGMVGGGHKWADASSPLNRRYFGK